jgi:hypothetical protein
MKSIIYKKHIIFTILLWLVAILSITYLNSHNAHSFSFVIIALSTFLGRKVLSNGTALNNKEKIFLIVSIVAMACISMIFMYNMAVNKIINAM